MACWLAGSECGGAWRGVAVPAIFRRKMGVPVLIVEGAWRCGEGGGVRVSSTHLYYASLTELGSM